MNNSLDHWLPPSADTLAIPPWRHSHQCPCGPHQLKQRIETEWCALHAHAPDVLDVSANTGLIMTGDYHVVHHANDHQLLQSGGRRINTASLQRLPYADQQFNTVIGLDVTPYCNLADVLCEWRRVAKPSGRIIVNVLSRAHYDRAHHLMPSPPLFNANNKMLSFADVLAIAHTAAVQLCAIQPYGFFTDANHWLQRTTKRHFWWQRWLEFAPIDARFGDFLLFLEQSVTQAPLCIAPYTLLVFANEPAQQHVPAPWYSDYHQLLNWTSLQQHSSFFNTDWRTRLNEHLRPLRNRVFFFQLCSQGNAAGVPLDWHTVLDEPYRTQLHGWQQDAYLDASLHQFCRTWIDTIGTDDSNDACHVWRNAQFIATDYDIMQALVINRQHHLP